MTDLDRRAIVLLTAVGPLVAAADTRAASPPASAPTTPGPDVLRTTGYRVAGDGGGAVYLRSTPGAGPGKIQSDDGAWWTLSPTQRLNVRMFGGAGDGATDDTKAFNAGIAFVLALGGGGRLEVPAGAYAVSEIDASGAAPDFTRQLHLVGDGPWCSQIVSIGSGKVLLNLAGTNQACIEGLMFKSTHVSQCAILLARLTTSGNCNNNRFRDLDFDGRYSIAPVVSIASESNSWIKCRFSNSHAAANHTAFFTGPRNSCGVEPGLGEVIATSSSNTDNHMFNCEFYAPYDGAKIVVFDGGAAYSMVSCTVLGAGGGLQLVTYQNPEGADGGRGGVFNGPVTWTDCHFEVFGGAGNVAHWLTAPAGHSFWNGINSVGGFYNCAPGTIALDWDRTDAAKQPVLSGSRWQSPMVAPTEGFAMYCWGLVGCDIFLRSSPNQTPYAVVATGFARNSRIKADVVRLAQSLTSDADVWVTGPPTTGVFAQGQRVFDTSGTPGRPLGWLCTVGGSLGALGAVYADTVKGSNHIVVSRSDSLSAGARIDIAGVGGGPFVVAKIVGKHVHLASACATAATGAALSASPATLVPFGATELTASMTYRATIAAGSVGPIQTLTLAGVSLGDFVQAAYGGDLQGLQLTAWARAANTVAFHLSNPTSKTITVAGRVEVRARR